MRERIIGLGVKTPKPILELPFPNWDGAAPIFTAIWD